MALERNPYRLREFADPSGGLEKLLVIKIFWRTRRGSNPQSSVPKTERTI
jgi:hypothetical protein